MIIAITQDYNVGVLLPNYKRLSDLSKRMFQVASEDEKEYFNTIMDKTEIYSNRQTLLWGREYARSEIKHLADKKLLELKKKFYIGGSCISFLLFFSEIALLSDIIEIILIGLFLGWIPLLIFYKWCGAKSNIEEYDQQLSKQRDLIAEFNLKLSDTRIADKAAGYCETLQMSWEREYLHEEIEKLAVVISFEKNTKKLSSLLSIISAVFIILLSPRLSLRVGLGSILLATLWLPVVFFFTWKKKTRLVLQYEEELTAYRTKISELNSGLNNTGRQ